jgi:REP element-mobilizing transposase RayT
MTPKQLELPTWGGRRKGAGRKPAGRLRRVSHKKRPQHAPRFPLHAVLRTREDVPRLRAREIFEAVRAALEAGAEHAGFRLVHYSVQGNHLHLIVEADDARALSRAMQGLAVGIARAINRAAARRGKVFADHYFARELRTPTEVRRAVRYVLDNLLLHASLTPRTDSCASSAPVAQPATWLLRIGWQRSRAGPLPVAYWAV